MKVMSFNVWYGGFRTGIDGVVGAIVAADADVVAVQEPYSQLRRIARRLGWHAAPRLNVISRFPIVQPGSGGRYGFLLVAPGEIVTIANTHNPCCPYGPNWIRVSRSRDEVLALERHKRVRWQQPFLDALEPLLGQGDQPIFFGGDFNAPSWRDWTPAVVKAQGWQPPTLNAKGPRYAVRWPTSLAMEDAGFRDSYREAHPDPIADPGYTWTSGHPGLSPWDIFDRIDFVWAAGPSETLSSRVVGEEGPFTDIVSEPWPSDHRAVVSKFRVTLGPAPDFVGALDVRVLQGHAVRVAFHADPAAGRTLNIWPKEADPATTPPVLVRSIGASVADGRRHLPTDGLAPGVYRLGVVDGANALLASSLFTLVDPNAAPTIQTDRRRYVPGQDIRVSWTGGDGNRFDWLAIYAAGANPARDKLWQWRYMDGRIQGSAAFNRASQGNWPLPVGRYQAFLCVDDDYVCVASSDPFRIA
jgi:endonuclease/exonuclease/phosphatase family metal-dependent hydrolase